MYKPLLSHIVFILLGYSLVFSTGFAQDLPDPTRPASAKGATVINSSAPRWTLTSTLIANGRRNAIINGQLVTPGQTINHAKVISIQPNEVWLLHKQKQIHIKLLARDIKDFPASAAK